MYRPYGPRGSPDAPYWACICDCNTVTVSALLADAPMPYASAPPTRRSTPAPSASNYYLGVRGRDQAGEPCGRLGGLRGRRGVPAVQVQRGVATALWTCGAPACTESITDSNVTFGARCRGGAQVGGGAVGQYVCVALLVEYL